MDGRNKEPEIVMEDSNEEQSSITPSNHSILSHWKVMGSRNISQHKKQLSQSRMSIHEHLANPSEVSISESELKLSLQHANLVNQFQLPSTLEAA